jgi:ABC-2 type transport system ATP-binding protein
MLAVEMDHVRKSYASVVALHELSLAIPQGHIHGLIGPNGAGKTTALRIMAGIIMPDAGAVRIFGQLLDSRHRATIGYLPEERGLYRRAFVEEMLIYLAELRGLRRIEARARIRRLAERLSIGAALSRRIEELSKGMEQKIQLIAGIIHDPLFLILDEPFTGLDPVNSALLVGLLLELKDRGRSILFSTHRMEQVERLCDQISFINRGRAVLQGSLPGIRTRFGARRTRLVYHGDPLLLDGHPAIESRSICADAVELRLRPEADRQEVLVAVAARATVLRYESVERSLEEIFIEAAGSEFDSNGE